MWRRILCALLAALMLLSLAACGGKNTEPEPEEPPQVTDPEPEIEPEIEPEPEPEIIANPLTGEPLEDPELVNARPIAVMINDIHYAMPQHGVSEADMIFEYNVESGITRMVGFFQEPRRVGTIGSVRSARACFVETVLGMDAIYAHAGGSDEALNMIRQLGVDDLDEGAPVYWRDAERRKTMAYEHTLMTSGENIADYLDSSGMRRDHKEDYSYPITFVPDATPVSGEDAAHVTARFSSYKSTSFDYDADSGKYMISQFNGPYVDGNTGEQVGTTNVLVLRTSVAYNGRPGGLMDIDVKGSNSGMFFCGGKCEPITWSKPSSTEPFTYYHADGTPLELQVGHTFVCVIGLSAELTYNG